jgi:hypothetical protein
MFRYPGVFEMVDSTNDAHDLETNLDICDDNLSNTESNNNNSDILDEVLFHAMHPRKIGILSSGGLSNNFVRKIQKKYPDFLPESSFETIFKIFQPPLPKLVPKVHSIPQPQQSPEPITLPRDHNSTQQISGNDDNNKNGEIIKQISLPDHESEHNYMPISNEQISVEPIIGEENPEYKDSIAPDPEKALSFKERTYRIFHDLKIKLGLGSKEDQISNDEAKTSEIPIKSEPEHKRENKPEHDVENEIDPRIDGLSQEISERKIMKTGKRNTHSFPVSDEISSETIPQSDIVEPLIPQYDITQTLKDKDIIFIITYLDDENDIENTIEILEHARSIHLFSVVITSLPRYFGKVDNVHIMNKVLQKLRLQAEMVLLLPYFDTLDITLIPDVIKELMELISEPGLINVDMADLKIIIKGGNVGIITFGTGRHANRMNDAFITALNSKLLNVELACVQKALLNVTGGPDMTISEVEAIAEQIRKRIKPGARLILGARINPVSRDSIKLFLMLGVTPMQVMVNRYSNE